MRISDWSSDVCSSDLNAEYRYDYFIANCATRVRDALDRASGGAIARASKGVASGRTYRFEATRLIGPVLPFALAMDAVMGPAGDAPIDRWQQSFVDRKSTRLNSSH